MKISGHIIVLLFISNLLCGQQFNFSPPLDIPIVLNGNFGEIRHNHFHSGIDIKTKGETGLPVFSIENGFVSRISVSPTGYGNAIYIDHPNGYTSVYGHLEEFSPEIQKWVISQQYREKSFEINLLPDKKQFVVIKGEEIAKSGNSGGSAGPHLHFEIRKTNNQHPVNPLFFNFDIKDKTNPVVENLMVYPLGDNSHVQNKTEKQQFKVVYFGESYHLKGIQTLDLFGEVGFGIDAIDYLDNNWSKCGIYQMEYWVDNKLINSFELDELDYDKMRFINSHIDYEAHIEKNQYFHKTFIDPGNKLDIYYQSKNNGVFNFNDGKKHKIQIVIFDVNMNSSTIEFNINSTKPINHIESKNAIKFDYERDNSLKNNNIELFIPEGALYSTINFEYKSGKNLENTYSLLHRVHNKNTPLQIPIDIKIKTINLPMPLQKKALIASFDIKTGKFSSKGGNFEKGWVNTTSLTFGDFCVVVDTIAPSIRSLSIKDDALAEKNIIRFKITDDFSGIKSYEGTIDGKWVLFQYDSKRDLLFYYFDDKIKSGKNHKLLLTVEDAKGNINTFSSNFFY